MSQFFCHGQSATHPMDHQKHYVSELFICVCTSNRPDAEWYRDKPRRNRPTQVQLKYGFVKTTTTTQQETVSGSGISWAICKSAPYITGQMPFLSPNKQNQSTGENGLIRKKKRILTLSLTCAWYDLFTAFQQLSRADCTAHSYSTFSLL